MRDWANDLATEEKKTSGVNFLRDANTGEWRGVRRAGAMKTGVESNDKNQTLYTGLQDTVAMKLPSRKQQSRPTF
jgi:hypothetical protein